MTQATIILTKQSTIKAIGEQRNSNRKEVFCDDGNVYASVTDAATHLGVTAGAVSQCVNGITKTCQGKRLFFARDALEHLNDIATTMRMQKKETIDYLEFRNQELRNENERLCKEMEQLREQLADTSRELEMYIDMEYERKRLKEERERRVAEAQATYYQRLRELENAKSLLEEAEAQMSELESEEIYA